MLGTLDPVTVTVTFGNVATYSTIPELDVVAVVGTGAIELIDGNVSDSKSLTLEASPLFTVIIAITSPFDLSTPNIVIMTLNMFTIVTSTRIRLKINIPVVTVIFSVGIFFPLQ